jgi:hypothetical protein
MHNSSGIGRNSRGVIQPGREICFKGGGASHGVGVAQAGTSLNRWRIVVIAQYRSFAASVSHHPSGRL